MDVHADGQIFGDVRRPPHHPTRPTAPRRARSTRVAVLSNTPAPLPRLQDRLETAQIYVSDTPDFGNGRPCSPLSDSSNNPESTTCAGDGGTSLLHAFYSYFFILGILVFYECVFHE